MNRGEEQENYSFTIAGFNGLGAFQIVSIIHLRMITTMSIMERNHLQILKEIPIGVRLDFV